MCFPTPQKLLGASILHFSGDTYYLVEGLIFLKGSNSGQYHCSDDLGKLIDEKDHIL